jgi:hypothetical protein
MIGQRGNTGMRMMERVRITIPPNYRIAKVVLLNFTHVFHASPAHAWGIGLFMCRRPHGPFGRVGAKLPANMGNCEQVDAASISISVPSIPS